MSEVFAFAIGTTVENRSGDVIDCFFPAPIKSPDSATSGLITARFKWGVHAVSQVALEAYLDATDSRSSVVGTLLSRTESPLVSVCLEADEPISSTPEAYLKLHLLSHRLALPNTLNLEGIFAHLPNVAWTTAGAIDVSELEERQLAARLQGEHLEVLSVDKFPKMTNYVVPNGVRIADTSRVRLGAYVGEGTTVMHEGLMNFNSGALGPNMVEGRISQGVVIGEHSDLGGSSSTMGTLSGGGQISITIGQHCLIGANAGTGIPLGDRCTIEAGLYITAGTPVTVFDDQGMETKIVKARELAGGSDMLFIRNGQTGQIQCRTNRKAIELNEQLHAHN
ncbi:MAG: 2,3,4,5-tetrahydropyridine-2,6-dicarboxylate N-succinyltransferase [Proteobacteria bacterium]|nr:2,3,4,5-tetrahydropyridine-2,6-dicarboxylate N-succinyltransferase [Pseudomonadota bacterium]